MMDTASDDRVKLDWSRLLGFDQLAPEPAEACQRTAAENLARIGPKVGIEDPNPKRR